MIPDKLIRTYRAEIKRLRGKPDNRMTVSSIALEEMLDEIAEARRLKKQLERQTKPAP